MTTWRRKHDAQTCTEIECSRCPLDEQLLHAWLRGFKAGMEAEREGEVPKTGHHTRSEAPRSDEQTSGVVGGAGIENRGANRHTAAREGS